MEAIAHQPTESQLRPHDLDDRAALEAALNNWRRAILTWLGDELRKAGEDRFAAEDGMAICYRNSCEVHDEIVSLLWDDLEESCMKMARLEVVIEAVEVMDTAKLLVLFSRTEKLKTYPWEGKAWLLPSKF